MGNNILSEKELAQANFYCKLWNKKIIVFGYGRRGRNVGNYLPSDIAYFVDNDPAKWQDSLNGFNVSHPDILGQENKNSVCIVVVSYYYKAILWQLQDMGYMEHVNVFNGLDFFGDILNKEIELRHNLYYNPDKVWLRGSPRIEGTCTFSGYNVVLDGSRLINTIMDRYSTVGRGCEIRNTRIGKFCSIGSEVIIGLERHPSRGFISTYGAFYLGKPTGTPSFVNKQLFEEDLPVQIGNDVWIGSRAMILGGIGVGDGAIIGAGSIVTKTVEPYSVVAGIPARLIRKRYDPKNIKRLLDFAWWDKEIEWIRKNAAAFSDEEKFFELI